MEPTRTSVPATIVGVAVHCDTPHLLLQRPAADVPCFLLVRASAPPAQLKEWKDAGYRQTRPADVRQARAYVCCLCDGSGFISARPDTKEAGDRGGGRAARPQLPWWGDRKYFEWGLEDAKKCQPGWIEMTNPAVHVTPDVLLAFITPEAPVKDLVIYLGETRSQAEEGPVEAPASGRRPGRDRRRPRR